MLYRVCLLTNAIVLRVIWSSFLQANEKQSGKDVYFNMNCLSFVYNSIYNLKQNKLTHLTLRKCEYSKPISYFFADMQLCST